jgi:hypothetical protein
MNFASMQLLGEASEVVVGKNISNYLFSDKDHKE